MDLFARFRARPPVIEHQDVDAALAAHRPSLFLVAGGHRGLSDPHSIFAWGFADDWTTPLTRPVEQPAELMAKGWISADSLRLAYVSTLRPAARASLSEAPIYDAYLRSALQWTGFELALTLHERVRAILDGLERPDERLCVHRQQLLIRLPTEPFDFPQPRGNADPWSGRPEDLAPLRTIARFDCNDMALAVVGLSEGSGPSLAERYGRKVEAVIRVRAG
ncbi:hypothetical protein [Sphingomonas astaxanthinifaciens]|uniref:Uncharacterized protein n=1 Tax=Sphingomonas astaxanthinifaciens DSM 22298 TaxID=1123267 RepID=A0ABQ5Z229_9SPHN|nr:hypothetical protein [Sphingomonas astaxanthinifaciens]GLR46814.1 hypothetical protein GCM10007925_05250 [Sphingomonas astaxanthinifaciens DSM 22298]